MTARLGKVVYWLCCALALIPGALFIGGVINLGPPQTFADYLTTATFAGAALVVWATGRAVRYVLAGA